MYNEAIKQRFLEWYRKGKPENPKYRSNFGKSEPLEVKFGKDLAEMNYQEAKEFMESLGIKGYTTIESLTSFFRQYVRWCNNNCAFTNMPGGFIELKSGDINMTGEIVEAYFKDEDDFFSTLKAVRDFDEGYVEVPYLSLAWSGLRKQEILELRDSDVDLDRRVIQSQDGEVLVFDFSDNVLDALSRYVNCKIAYRDHRTGPRQVIKDLSTDMFLKKILPRSSDDFGKPYTEDQLNTQINGLCKLCKKSGVRPIKFLDVWRSGRLSTMNKIEQSGVDVLSLKNKDLVEAIFRGEQDYYDVLKMYEGYKAAFGL